VSFSWTFQNLTISTGVIVNSIRVYGIYMCQHYTFDWPTKCEYFTTIMKINHKKSTAQLFQHFPFNTTC